jgi:protein-disulfide isomerase
MVSVRSIAIASLLVGLALGGCQKQDEQTQKKLDHLISKVEGLEKKIAAGGGPRAGGPGQPGQMPDRKRPDAAAVYSLDVSGAPAKGPADAKVTIVKGFEFACPYCLRVRETMDQLLKDYEGKIRLVEMQYVVHPQTATLPAQATCAAHNQGKYFEYEDILWKKGFPNVLGGGYSEENLLKYAEEAKLNVDKFKADLNSDACKKKVQSEQARLAAIGTTGTPAFYINGRFLSGARPIDQFKALIDEELKKADEAINGGKATAANYYQKMVVEAGKKAL